MNQELITAFMRSGFPCNPLPFLNGIIEGVQTHGTDFIKTNAAQAMLLTVIQQSYGQASTVDTFEEYQRLKKVIESAPDIDQLAKLDKQAGMKFPSLSIAAETAIRVSKENGYAAIVLSKGMYYVEVEPPLVRVWEELYGEYKDGKLIDKD